MASLFSINLYSLETTIGFIWTIAILWILYSARGARISSEPILIPAALFAAYFTLPVVVADIAVLTKMAGGITTLDVHVGYQSEDITAFAVALGESGRFQYAQFQLGVDTLAPPALAGVMLVVGRSTIKQPETRRLITILVSIYFISVLLANALMPVYMLNFPDVGGHLSTILYFLLPILDGIKYALHAVFWLVIILAWLFNLKGYFQAE